VAYSDPYVPRLEARAWAGAEDLTSLELTPSVLADADCVVVLTDHSTFDYAAVVAHADLVVDTRNAVKAPAPHVFRLGAPMRSEPAGQRDELERMAQA
jgi:UDP-N-acetyl-D-glucosamine dehydrogenase